MGQIRVVVRPLGHGPKQQARECGQIATASNFAVRILWMGFAVGAGAPQQTLIYAMFQDAVDELRAIACHLSCSKIGFRVRRAGSDHALDSMSRDSPYRTGISRALPQRAAVAVHRGREIYPAELFAALWRN